MAIFFSSKALVITAQAVGREAFGEVLYLGLEPTPPPVCIPAAGRAAP
jgi:hypothetical protein